MDLKKFLGYGADITGAAIPSLLAVAIGDPTAGAVSQLAVICIKELNDYVLRPQSINESKRSAASLIFAFTEIQKRLDKGETIRTDDFFREKTGVATNASTVLEGVLVKAKQQYEEAKVRLLGNLISEISFNEKISADDACWYLNLVDSLNYQSLLILATFYNADPQKWSDSNIFNIYEADKVIAQQIYQMRSNGLLTSQGTFQTNITITDVGKLLVEAMQLVNELDTYGQRIKTLIC